MSDLGELLKCATYEEALQKLAADPPAVPGWQDQLSQHWNGLDPTVRHSLMGAGIGAAGMGLTSLLAGRKKKRSLLGDTLSGAALGGLGGLGYSMLTREPAAKDPTAAVADGRVAITRAEAHAADAYVNRTTARGEDPEAGPGTSVIPRWWDRLQTQGLDGWDALWGGTGAVGALGLNTAGRAIGSAPGAGIGRRLLGGGTRLAGLPALVAPTILAEYGRSTPAELQRRTRTNLADALRAAGQ